VTQPLFLSLLALPLLGQVQFDVKSDRTGIRVNGRPFSTLHFGKEAHKPFLHPLLTASGKAVTRGFPVDPLPGDATDHPHQRGLWIGAEHLSGMDFWENDPGYNRPNMGTIEFKDLSGVADGKDRGTLSLLAHWISQGGKPVIIERRKMTFYSEPANCRMFDIDLELEAVEKVTFEDHHDAVLGLRLALPFDDHYGGRLVNAEGGVNEEGVRGRRSPWLDWTADLNGEKVGVAVFDHPSNLNYPTRWHVRAMGLVAANPFASRAFDQAAPVAGHTLERGGRLRLRYRILIHPAAVKADRFFEEFAWGRLIACQPILNSK
jgi:hypothetical protein